MKRNIRTKRGIAWLLTLTLVLTSLCGTLVSAEEIETETAEAAEDSAEADDAAVSETTESAETAQTSGASEEETDTVQDDAQDDAQTVTEEAQSAAGESAENEAAVEEEAAADEEAVIEEDTVSDEAMQASVSAMSISSSASVISSGTKYTATISTAGSSVYYSFTPSETTYYDIYTSGNFDTVAYLYDADENLLAENDDISSTDTNSEITYLLTADATYYIEVCLASSSKTASFYLQVDEAVTSGTTGSVSWAVTADSDGEIMLAITGSGAMASYSTSDIPWRDYAADITAITIGSGVTSIGQRAFYRCTAVTSVSMADTVTSIGYRAFYGCSALGSIVIADGVTSIADSAFAYCYSLESVVFGYALTSIGEDAFLDCTMLTSLTFTGKAPSIDEYAFEGVSADAYYPASRAGSWTADVLQDYGGSLTWYAQKLSLAEYGTATLSKTSYTYNGKTRKPSVTVVVAGVTLTADEDYTVSYASGRKSIGKYAVTVTAADNSNYTGSITKYFTIKPGQVTLKSTTASKSKKKITVKWKKVSGGVRYQIAYKKKGSSTWKYKTVSAGTYSKTLSGLTSGKKYYVKVRAYKSVNGTKYYGSWSSTKTIKVK